MVQQNASAYPRPSEFQYLGSPPHLQPLRLPQPLSHGRWNHSRSFAANCPLAASLALQSRFQISPNRPAPPPALQGDPCGGSRCAESCSSLCGLHLTVAWDFCIAGCDAGCCLRCPAVCRALRLARRALRHNRHALTALVRFQTLVYFLLPRWLGGGLANQCAQISRFPSDAVLESAFTLRTAVQVRNAGKNCRMRTLLLN